MAKIDTATRKIIRNAAEMKGCKYRITAEGEVHFYGKMPNTNIAGWYLFAMSVGEAVAQIKQ